MSNDFSNSQDGILANIMRNQSHDPLAMETRDSERSGSVKGVTLPKREVDLDVYAEEPIIWLGYHKTWLGKEVTFNLRRNDQPNLITAIYEGGFDNPEEGLITYSLNGSQKIVRVESIRSVESSDEPGTTFWVHLDDVRQQQLDMKKRRLQSESLEALQDAEQWFWAKMAAGFAHEIVAITFQDSPNERFGWFGKSTESVGIITLTELMSTRKVTIQENSIKSIRTLMRKTQLTFDYETLTAVPPITITPKELGFTERDISWRQFSTTKVNMRLKEDFSWDSKRPAQTLISGYIANLLFPKGLKSGHFVLNHEGGKVNIPIEKVLTITIDEDQGIGDIFRALPNTEDRSSRSRSHSVRSRRSTKSVRSRAQSVKSTTSFRSMRDQDFDTSEDEDFHQPVATSSQKGSDDDNDDSSHKEFTIRDPREEWEELVQRDPTVLMTPKHILEPESKRIIERLPKHIQKAISKTARIANAAWVKPGRESFSIEKLLRPIQKAWAEHCEESNRTDTSSSSSEEETVISSPGQSKVNIREDVLELINSQENWDSLYSADHMVSYQVWKDLPYHPRLFERLKEKGYAKYVTNIFEAEHLFHTEQIPFTPRIMVSGFRKSLRERDPADPPGECEFAILDLLSETSAALSNGSLHTPSLEQMEHQITLIAKSTNHPAKLITAAQKMHRAIWNHKLHITPYQAWEWQEKIEEANGSYRDRATLIGIALRITDHLREFREKPDHITLAEYAEICVEAREHSGEPLIRHHQQANHIFGYIKAGFNLSPTVQRRIDKFLQALPAGEPPAHHQVMELVHIIVKIMQTPEPSGAPLSLITGMNRLVEEVRGQRLNMPPTTTETPIISGRELVEAFREWLEQRGTPKSDVSQATRDKWQQLQTHPRIKQILTFELAFDSPRAMLAAAAVNPEYWKKLSPRNLLKFCAKLNSECDTHKVPNELNGEWDEVRFKRAVQEAKKDMPWRGSIHSLDWLRLPLLFSTRTQAEQISILELMTDMASAHDAKWCQEETKIPAVRDFTAFMGSYHSWRRKAHNAIRRNRNTTSEAWENSYHPFLTKWDDNTISHNRLRLSYNGFGLPSESQWKAIWNQVVSAPMSQVRTDGPAGPHSTMPTMARLDTVAAMHITEADLDIFTEPVMHSPDWQSDGMNSDGESSRTTELRKEAKEMMEALPHLARNKIETMYNRWREGYPTLPFGEMLLQVTGDIIQDIQDPDIRQQLLEPQFQLFGMDGVPHADQEWYRLFSIHSTQSPPTGDMAEKEQHRLMGNLKDDFGFQQLNEVTADDFLPNGRFAAYYIGRQLSVPTAIISRLQLSRNVGSNSDLLQIVWRKLYSARLEAEERTRSPSWRIEAPADLHSPWVRLLMDMSVAKSFQYDNIDIVQAIEAKKAFHSQNLNQVSTDDLYSAFIRPIERLFTMEMPLNSRLIKALHTKDGTNDMVRYICRLVGWDEFPLRMSANELLEQLSRIRATSSNQLVRFSPNDQPHVYYQRIQLRRSKHNHYKGGSTREALRKKHIKAPEGWYLPTRREFQERIRINLEQLREDEAVLDELFHDRRRLNQEAQANMADTLRKDLNDTLAALEMDISGKCSWISTLWKIIQTDVEARNLMEMTYDRPDISKDTIRRTPRALLKVQKGRMEERAVGLRNQFRNLLQRIREAGPTIKNINAKQLSNTFETMIDLEESYKVVRSNITMIHECMKWDDMPEEIPEQRSEREEPQLDKSVRPKTPTPRRPDTPAPFQVPLQNEEPEGQSPRKRRAMTPARPRRRPPRTAGDITWWETTEQGTTGPSWVSAPFSAQQLAQQMLYFTRENESDRNEEPHKVNFPMETPTGREYVVIKVTSSSQTGPVMTIQSHKIKRKPDGTPFKNTGMNKKEIDIPILLVDDIRDTLNKFSRKELPPLAAERITDPILFMAEASAECPQVKITVKLTSSTKYGKRYRDLTIIRHNTDGKPAMITLPWIHLDMIRYHFQRLADEFHEQNREFIRKEIANRSRNL